MVAAKYRKVSRDKSHIGIANDLKALGYSVADLAMVGSGVPDMLVASRDYSVLIEIKEPGGHIYLRQLEFISLWKGYVGFAQTTDEARRLLTYPATYCLSTLDKQNIAKFAVEYKRASKSKDPKILVTALCDTLSGVK